MKFYLYFLCILIFFNSQAQDTIFYDIDWNKTTKVNHAYYRPIPLRKVGELLILVDYYKNGTMQFQGYVKPGKEDIYIGDAYWYEENGVDSSSQQSINETSQQELTYYNQDGSIWQIIEYDANGQKSKIAVYLKGKELFSGSILDYNKYQGTFSPKIPDDYYDRPELEEKTIGYTEVATTISVETSGNSTPTNPKEFYHEIIYWENGTKAKESKWGAGTYWNNELIEEKYWDESGKLISEINFEFFSPTKKYLEIEFYTRNNFAVKTQEKRELMDRQKDGITTFYKLNGEIDRTVKYRKGEKTEEISFQNGKQLISYYKNFEPFEGIFTQQVSNKSKTYTLVKGKKEGKVTVRDLEADKIFAEGIYMNDLPVEGLFYLDEKQLQLLQYKNGKQEGIQKIYANYWGDELKEEFEMKNGKREGFRKQYDKGELKFESIYKNDIIFSGKIREGEQELTYADGNLTERLLFKDYYEGLEMMEKYVNNQLDLVVYFNFTIAENPQENYQGKYKNGKPFQGYFAIQKIVDDIYLIDYYENGELKYQYSFEILEQMENYRHYTYYQKAEFKNGNILNGSEFLPPTDNGFLKINYANGATDALEVNLFTMHYFNRISFIRKNDEILVSEFQSPYTLKIFLKDNRMAADLYENEKLIKTQEAFNETKDGSPNSITFYYLQENQIRTFSVAQDDFDEGEIDRYTLVFKIFSMFPFNTNSLDVVMDKLINAFKTEDMESFHESEETFFPFKREEYLSSVEYGEQGQIDFGIRIKQEKNGEILLEGIENDKVKKSLKVKSISELTANQNKILENLMHQLLNE